MKSVLTQPSNVNHLANPSSDQIAAELSRVLESADFSGSEQLTQFLAYIVNESLEDRADRLKERNIAIDALGRSDDYDPRVDSIVRVVAGKLRRALELYYARDGARNPLRIEVPKGSYKPTFQVNSDRIPGSANRFGAVNHSDKKTVRDLKASNSTSHRRNFAVGALLLVALTFGGAWFWSQSHRPKFSSLQASDPTLIVRAGALPYRLRDDKVEVLLVRTERDSHWTIPKARQDSKAPMWQTAQDEAFDEAGVHGHSKPTVLGEYFYERKQSFNCVVVYPVLVNEVATNWPNSARKRKWCDQEIAAETVASTDLGRLIAEFEPSTALSQNVDRDDTQRR